MARLSSILRFWYEFLCGDDPRITVGVVATLAITAGVARNTTMPAWWIVVVGVLVVLPISIRRAVRHTKSPRT